MGAAGAITRANGLDIVKRLVLLVQVGYDTRCSGCCLSVRWEYKHSRFAPNEELITRATANIFLFSWLGFMAIQVFRGHSGHDATFCQAHFANRIAPILASFFTHFDNIVCTGHSIAVDDTRFMFVRTPIMNRFGRHFFNFQTMTGGHR